MVKMTVKPKADLQELMLQACKEMKCAGISMGFAVAQSYLREITERAIELKDEKLLEALEGLGLVTKEDENDRIY